FAGADQVLLTGMDIEIGKCWQTTLARAELHPELDQALQHGLTSAKSELFADGLRWRLATIFWPESRRPGANGASSPEDPAAAPEAAPESTLIMPLQARGKVLGVLAVAMGPSGRQHRPADLAVADDLAGRIGIALDNARLYRDIQEADRRKNEFLNMLAHELRNPLAPIRNAVEI